MSKQATPKGLGEIGARLWRDVVDKYDLRADELVTLESACRASDRIADMEAERDGQFTATGSTGQLVVHPLVAEIRAHEAQVTKLLATLKLPDESAGSASESRSTQARAAAQSRWAAAHGASA